MANNIHNLLVFKSQESFDKFLNNYVTQVDDECPYVRFDFTKVIPYPKKKDCPDKYNIESPFYSTSANLQPILGYEYLDWYNWCNDNWGTKWSSYNCSMNEQKKEFFFDTAWSTPYPVLEKLFKDNPDFSDNVTGISCCEFNGCNVCETWSVDSGILVVSEHNTNPEEIELEEIKKIPYLEYMFLEYTDEDFDECFDVSED